KRMKPNITVEERIVTTNLQIYYCSLCNKQLFILGGYNYKPFWERPIYLWFLGPFWALMDLWEIAKTLIKEKERNYILLIIITGLFLVAILTLLPKHGSYLY
ncbi:TPA: hypothetical protein ACT9A7_000554, partial [Legionella pneumophila]